MLNYEGTPYNTPASIIKNWNSLTEDQQNLTFQEFSTDIIRFTREELPTSLMLRSIEKAPHLCLAFRVDQMTEDQRKLCVANSRQQLTRKKLST